MGLRKRTGEERQPSAALDIPARLPHQVDDSALPPPAEAPPGDGTGGVDTSLRPGELAVLKAFAQKKVDREREARGNPAKLLALRAEQGASKASSSSGNVAAVEPDSVMAQICKALGVDASGQKLDGDADDEKAADGKEELKSKKKKRKRKKKRSRHRRRRSSSRRSSSSSSYSSDRSQSSFRFASGGSVGHENAIRETSLRKPGLLLKQGLQQMEKLVNPSVGTPGGEKVPTLPPSAHKYLTTLVHVAQKMNLGRRDRQELQTLAQCLDCLAMGRLAPLGDMLMQRFKAVETAVATKSWEIAPHMELVQANDGTGVTSNKEQELAAKRAFKEAQLRTLMDKSRHQQHPQAGRRGDGG